MNHLGFLGYDTIYVSVSKNIFEGFLNKDFEQAEI
jgi:hypothetical protein